MTTIAWDGKTLAVDSSNSMGDTMLLGSCQKIWRLDTDFGPGNPAVWVTFTGQYQDGMQFLNWYMLGQPHDNRPTLDESFAALVWDPATRTLWRYEHRLAMYVIQAPFYACGSGREYALGAMMAGANAEAAVEIACILDVWSKGPVRSSNAPPAPGPKRGGLSNRSVTVDNKRGKHKGNGKGGKGKKPC